MAQKRPYSPRRARVETGHHGRPIAVEGIAVEQIREEWLVEDGWWTGTPLKRHYYELVLSDGRNAVVFRDESLPVTTGGNHWHLQRA